MEVKALQQPSLPSAQSVFPAIMTLDCVESASMALRQWLPPELQREIVHIIAAQLCEAHEPDQGRNLTPFRLVCKAWNAEIRKEIIRRFQVIEIAEWCVEPTLLCEAVEQLLRRTGPLPREEANQVLYNEALAIADTGCAPALELLLDAGVSPNLDGGGFTMLHCAVDRNSVACARLLIARGAHPDVEGQRSDGSGRMFLTPLARAVSDNMLDVAAVLMDAGARLIARTVNPHTTYLSTISLLDAAIRNRNLALAYELLRRGCSKRDMEEAARSAIALNYGEMRDLLLAHPFPPERTEE